MGILKFYSFIILTQVTPHLKRLQRREMRKCLCLWKVLNSSLSTKLWTYHRSRPEIQESAPFSLQHGAPIIGGIQVFHVFKIICHCMPYKDRGHISLHLFPYVVCMVGENPSTRSSMADDTIKDLGSLV